MRIPKWHEAAILSKGKLHNAIIFFDEVEYFVHIAVKKQHVLIVVIELQQIFDEVVGVMRNAGAFVGGWIKNGATIDANAHNLGLKILTVRRGASEIIFPRVTFYQEQ